MIVGEIREGYEFYKVKYVFFFFKGNCFRVFIYVVVFDSNIIVFYYNLVFFLDLL